MAIWRRGFSEDAAFREIELTELTLTTQALRLQPFIFIMFCVVLTMGMPRWFCRNNRLHTFWCCVLTVTVALEVFITEYERRALQAFNDRWRLKA
ncbi:hypothetical protein RHMOL_Rhmol07G0199700 [Rhododendron molle]|uniref:Uncharacterized protein n=1 Tax=Rhododendron molle TaxID=49168 RepID=A0ACC0N2E9_RHOML|nr:hypothetical protein RHMOL_Rhmol07G0199700 [Rhododendron molle]